LEHLLQRENSAAETEPEPEDASNRCDAHIRPHKRRRARAQTQVAPSEFL